MTIDASAMPENAFESQPRFWGIYRGQCVDTADPDGLGRIRAVVPQVLGEAVSNWASPCWSLGELWVNAADRLPAYGTAVWVMFESGETSKPVWMGVR